MSAEPSLPLLCPTPPAWAELAAANLPVFLSDHAVCEQQAALYALALIGHYPDDAELVERMAALATEEVGHLRRVLGILHRRNFQPAGRRANLWVQGLHFHLKGVQEPRLKADRLLVGALIEARSCERFTRLLEVVSGRDLELASLLRDLGPAEERHWQLFYGLAEPVLGPAALAERWQSWLKIERDLSIRSGIAPTVHG